MAQSVLPYENRYAAIQYETGDVGEVRYPINYEELYNLKGRLLTLVDATFTDPEQRKAQKNVIWNTLRDWMKGIEENAELPPLVHRYAESTDGSA